MGFSACLDVTCHHLVSRPTAPGLTFITNNKKVQLKSSLVTDLATATQRNEINPA